MFLGVISLLGLLGGALGRDLYGNIAYFWHITDIHYDAHTNSHGDARKGCWRSDYENGGGGNGNGGGGGGNGGNGGRAQARRPTCLFGDYSSDSTWALVESAARTMQQRQSDNVEFILWTGDALSNHAMRRLSPSERHDYLQNITDLLGKHFPSQFVFPALGHDDLVSKRELGKMWAKWLPPDSISTFETGGYYIIERKMLKLQIVVLNTNLIKSNDHPEEAEKQWVWLEKVLTKFQKSGETAYLVGHIPPGADERQRGVLPPTHGAYTDKHNRKYLSMVRKYSSIIVGQFFGHLHSDTFRVFYDEKGLPVNWALLAPSVTPKRTHDGPNNPGLRLYKFDKDTGQVYDYTQFYLDLSTANTERRADWHVEYNFSSYYGMNEVSAATLHTLAERMTQYAADTENSPFNKYYKANSVRINTRSSSTCDDTCVRTHYCAIVRVDYQEFAECLKSTPSALSALAVKLQVCGAFVVVLIVSVLRLV